MPILVGCCYRLPSSNVKYFNRISENLDIVTDERKAIILLDDLNIDWFSKNCPVCKKLAYDWM